MRLTRAALAAGSVVLLATCDMVTAPAPKHVVVAYRGDSTLVVGQTAVPSVAVSVDGERVADPRVRYTSLDTTRLRVSADGRTVTALRRGPTPLSIALYGSMLPADAPPTVQTVLVTVGSVAIAGPTEDTLTSLGEGPALAAVATDVHGDTIRDPVEFAFTSSDSTVVEVSAAGRVTARRPGTAAVAASVDGRADTVTVRVIQQLDHLRFRPEFVQLDALGAAAVVLAEGRDARDSLITFAPGTPTEWASEDTSIATVDAAGVVRARAQGTTYVNAARGGVTGRLRVDVDQVATRVEVSPATPAPLESPGDTVRLGATLRDRLGSPMPDSAMWESLDPTVASVAARGGLVTARELGADPRVARVVARADAAADTVLLYVRNRPASVVIGDRRPQYVSAGDVLRLTAEVRNARDAAILGLGVTWRSADPSVVAVTTDGAVTVAGLGDRIMVYATAVGYPLLADSVPVTALRPVALVSIAADALSLTTTGQVDTVAVTIKDDVGTLLDPAAARWTSSNASVVTVSATGVITAVGLGDALVIARAGTVADTVLVHASNDPAAVELDAAADYFSSRGQSRTYTATVRNGLGVPIAGAAVGWTSSSTNVATVTALNATQATVTTVGNGVALVVAAAGMAADTVRVTVDEAVRRVVVVPKDTTLTSVGDTLRLSASALNASGGEVGVFTYAWRAADAADAAVARVLDDGRVIALAAGNARVIGALGDFADTAFIHVTNVATSVSILPAADTLRFLGATDRPAVDIRNARGLPIDDRRAVTWSSGDPSVATVSADGVISAAGTGRTHVRASAGSSSDTIGVVVTNDAVSLRVTAPATALVVRQSVTYTATAFDAAGAAMPGVPSAWESSNSSVATVSGSGVVSAIGPGSAWIVARSQGLSDSALVSVRRLTLLHVDGSTGDPVQLGTPAQPYARIQDAIAATQAGDTVFVHRTAAAYAEPLAITRGLTLLGDATAYAGDPNALPTLAHAAGGAAVTVATSEPVTVRYLTIRHSTDGLAIDAQGAAIQLSDVHVNPGATQVVGGGIVLSGGARAMVERVTVTAVRGAGVRLADVADGVITDLRVRGAEGPCVQASGAATSARVTGGEYADCGTGALVLSGRVARVRGVRVASSGAASVAVQLTATDSASVAASVIAGHALATGLQISGGVVRVDSNRVAGNATGISVVRWTGIESFRDNDLMDNAVAGVQNSAGSSLALGATWWGDGRGVRRTAVGSNPGSAGDTVSGLVTATARLAPLFPGAGASALRKLRGDGQTGRRGTYLTVPLTVRIVDADGRPVAGVSVTFAVLNGGRGLVGPFGSSKGGATYTVATNASGLAEAALRLDGTEGVNTVGVSAPGVTSLTFLATGTR